MVKFPSWPSDPIHAAAVVAEECGELQKAVNEAVYEPFKGSRANIGKEAVQTAAMCLRFLASMESYEWYHTKQHAQAALALAPAPASKFEKVVTEWNAQEVPHA